MINEGHAKLLEARGFEIEVLDNLGIESSTKLGPDTIAIPILEAGVRINAKYRTISGEKRFSQEPGAKPVFWNVDRITDETLKDEPLIITEGELDAIAAIQSGFGRVVSVPNGAPQRGAKTRAPVTSSWKTPPRRFISARRSFSLLTPTGRG